MGARRLRPAAARAPRDRHGVAAVRGGRRTSLAVLAAAAVGRIALLTWTNSQPHTSALGEDGPAPSCSASPLDESEATQHIARNFPAPSVANYKQITQDTISLVDSGDQSGGQSRITDLETAWDDDQSSLQPKDCQAWTYVDQRIDPALSAVRDNNPDPATEDQALQTLLTTLG